MTPAHQNHRKEGQGTWQMHKDPASTQPRSAGSRSKEHTSPLKQKSSSNTHPATLASPKGEEAKESGSGARRTYPRCHSPRRGRQGPGLMRGAHQGPSSAFRRAGSRAQQRSNVKRGKRGREKESLLLLPGSEQVAWHQACTPVPQEMAQPLPRNSSKFESAITHE